jgi:hypothetical protein
MSPRQCVARRVLLFGELLLLCVLASGSPARAENSVIVRVPAVEWTSAVATAVRPTLVVDYGAFRWLELSTIVIRALDGRGVAYEVVSDAR